ncbi:hypothetical protein P152DRAFT_441373 [Eremomyces bilateralis CBS 781.70]|uniref:Uncharacterized protein n=1 Tax=Eremomyces bilateralis CBS 781.70 TaxID=1392243 RepID=A0A6G1FV43_9PEZI|nr:uncharacterized protein P152DRAFT_441373 [Eremomyces bilateralis CBS 781.70]KAF1809576.1 hypothetical protein P152DRAFT_441373 [Eremomyces bilateralis CBS 781.70]
MASEGNSWRQSKPANLLSLLTYYPVWGTLLSYLCLADFLVLFQVSKGIRRKLKDNLGRKCLNIDILLSNFVTHPDIFRSQLGKHDALISGGFALNFFELSRWTVLNMDVFVPSGVHATEFTDYICKHEGYKASEEYSQEAETGRGHFNFNSGKRPGKTLRVTVTDGPPIQTILDSSYTTASINFITWNKAYSIFPIQTVIHHKLYALKPMDEDFGSVLNELSNQGWTTRDIIWPELAADAQSHEISGYRRVGDQSTLVILLHTYNVQKASTPDSVTEYAQFEVSTNSVPPFFEQDRLPNTQIQLQRLVSPALRYEYTFGKSSWHDFVSKRLQRWAWVELYKLEPGKRPLQFTDGIPHYFNISFLQDFQTPETWDYADDQIPAWYLEWEQITIDRSDRKGRSRHQGRHIL